MAFVWNQINAYLECNRLLWFPLVMTSGTADRMESNVTKRVNWVGISLTFKLIVLAGVVNFPCVSNMFLLCFLCVNKQQGIKVYLEWFNWGLFFFSCSLMLTSYETLVWCYFTNLFTTVKVFLVYFWCGYKVLCFCTDLFHIFFWLSW